MRRGLLAFVCARMASGLARPSKRVRATDDPCIVTMQKMLKGKEGIMSLAQGIVHWPPPACVADAVIAAAGETETYMYGADEGLAPLRTAILEKLKVENGIEGVNVMITAGANQAYTNVVMALIDAEDGAVLFAPYYFNHLMALQMTGGGGNVALGPSRKEDFLPDLDWLEKRFEKPETSTKYKMVTVVNPNNPTGLVVPKEHLDRLSELCKKHGAWLVVDNTYELFTYEEEGGPVHASVSGDHVVNVYSFSKAYGMMGYRVGYLAYPPALHDQLMKVQDTIAICPSIVSQKAALAALTGAGTPWVRERVQGLTANRKVIVAAVESALGPGKVIGGTGAIYLLVRLPEGCGMSDVRIVEWLCDSHKVCAIPGSACGAPGMIRVCYANLESSRCKEAAERLRAGLTELATLATKGAAIAA